LPEEKVEATGMSTGLVLSHELAHLCCLSAKTSASVEQGKVLITETLSGVACRCRCASTLRTAVGLEKGSYSVEVKVVEPGGERVAWTGTIEVR
jgi:hypothetical protein